MLIFQYRSCRVKSNAYLEQSGVAAPFPLGMKAPFSFGLENCLRRKMWRKLNIKIHFITVLYKNISNSLIWLIHSAFFKFIYMCMWSCFMYKIHRNIVFGVCFKIAYSHDIFWGNNIYLNGWSIFLCWNHCHAKLYQAFCFCCSISVFSVPFILKFERCSVCKSRPTARINPQHHIQINWPRAVVTQSSSELKL